MIDTLKLIPFLFLTYLVMEYLEHRTEGQTRRLMKRAGRLGPVVGGALGIVPQCGFAAAASGLYAGRVITMGTLLAVYLSTSDEMLPILISEQAPAGEILKLLLIKAAIGILAGLAVDLLSGRRRKGKQGDGRDAQDHIHGLCEKEHCGCEKGILRSAIVHTMQIGAFILLVTFALNLLLHFLGEDVLETLVLNKPVLGPVLAGLVGLIPNCAGSVVITQLYLRGAMGLGAAMAGLLTGTGVGLVVLFKMLPRRRDGWKVLGLLYFIGVLAGIVVGLF